jgi:hypothetical protein
MAGKRLGRLAPVAASLRRLRNQADFESKRAISAMRDFSANLFGAIASYYQQADET